MIVLQDVVKIFKQGDDMITAANHLSAVFQDGLFSSITGPSGCGKSTLLNLISGISKPNSGSVRIGNTELTALSDRKCSEFRLANIGYVYQDFGLVPVMTAYENICVPLKLRRIKPDQSEIFELCGMMGIADRLHHLPSELSGGEKQRIAIVRAMLGRPQILIADEPTGNLDKSHADAVMESLVRMQKTYKVTLIMVTHDRNLAALADEQFYMEQGTIKKL